MMRLVVLFLMITFYVHGQKKPVVYYNEKGKEISKQKFTKAIDYHKNLDLYFENDSTQIGILITRQKFGVLDKITFSKLKDYLISIAHKPIDSTQNIVINYLTAFPIRDEIIDTTSNWSVLNKDYLKKLHRIANINQFWLYAPGCNSLKFNHLGRINWKEDKDNQLEELFFPYRVKHGNYILIRPDGKYFYYLGEHGKYDIWKSAKKFF